MVWKREMKTKRHTYKKGGENEQRKTKKIIVKEI